MAVVHGTNIDFKVPSLDLRFSDRKDLIDTISGEDLITFTRNSVGTYVDADGLIKTTTTNEARFDHDPETNESLGLLVEEARTNSVTYSSQMPQAFTATEINVTPNAGLAPDGTNTAVKLAATTASDWHFYQENLSSASLRTLSLYVKSAGEDTVYLGIYQFAGQGMTADLSAGTASGGTITPVGNGWYRISYTVDYPGRYFFIIMPGGRNINAGDGTSGILVWGPQLEAGTFPTSYIPTPATFTSRASTATYYDASGVIQTAGIDVARDNAYFPDENGVMQPAGLLLEAAGTNLFLYSDQLDDFYWTKTNISLTQNAAVAPDGNTTADLLAPDATDGNHKFSNVRSDLSTTTHSTFSVFVKYAGHRWIRLRSDGSSNNNYFDVLNGVIGTTSTADSTSVSISKLANDWYRITLTYLADSRFDEPEFYFAVDDNDASTFTGNGTDGVYFWGAQLEASPFPTSYIPTAGSTVTRAADVSSSSTVTRAADVASITGTNFSSWYNQDQGTFTLKTSALKSSAGGSILLGGISGAGYGEIEIFNNITEVWFIDYLNSPFRKISHDVSVGENRISASYDNQTAQAIAVNGTVSTTSQAFTANTNIITGITLMYRNPAGLQTTGHISRLTYYPTRLSNALLQKLTK